MAKNDIVEIAEKVHAIMQAVTKNLTIPDTKQASFVRKKISVFSYGIFVQLAEEANQDCDQAYSYYLTMGGLDKSQAATIVKRTRDEFSQMEFGEASMELGKAAAKMWNSDDTDLSDITNKLSG